MTLSVQTPGYININKKKAEHISPAILLLFLSYIYNMYFWQALSTSCNPRQTMHRQSLCCVSVLVSWILLIFL